MINSANISNVGLIIYEVKGETLYVSQHNEHACEIKGMHSSKAMGALAEFGLLELKIKEVTARADKLI